MIIATTLRQWPRVIYVDFVRLGLSTSRTIAWNRRSIGRQKCWSKWAQVKQQCWVCMGVDEKARTLARLTPEPENGATYFRGNGLERPRHVARDWSSISLGIYFLSYLVLNFFFLSHLIVVSRIFPTQRHIKMITSDKINYISAGSINIVSSTVRNISLKQCLQI